LVQIRDLTRVIGVLVRSDNHSEGSWLCCRNERCYLYTRPA